MKKQTKKLFPELQHILKFHRRESDTTMSTLNRLFQGNVAHVYKELGFQRCVFHAHRIILQKECWSTKKLSALRRCHARKKVGGDKKLPIVLVRLNGRDHLIDGNTRINYWVAAHDKKMHDVIIVTQPSRHS